LLIKKFPTVRNIFNFFSIESIGMKHLFARSLLTFSASALLFSTSSIRILASAADLDPTFGNGGKVTTDFFGSAEMAFALAIQSDGKIVAAGPARNAQGVSDFGVSRYNSDGSLDLSFGTGGKVSTDFFEESDQAFAMALQPDGRIIVAGRTFSDHPGSDFALARYNANGTLDSTFGSDGKVITDLGSDQDLVFAVAVQSDGKVVAVGTGAGDGTLLDFGIARYDSNGSLDSTFGTGGKVTTDFFGDADHARDIAIESDGKLIVGGFAFNGSNWFDFAIARYNSDGTLDSTFGNNGKTSTDFSSTNDQAFAIGIQPEGKIILAGFTQTLGPSGSIRASSDFALVRYNSDGSLDSSFGSMGRVTTDFSGDDDEAFSLAIDRNSKIVVGGFARNEASSFDFALARYNPNGSLDAAFGFGGKTTTDFFGNDDEAFALALDSSGRIILAGSAGPAGRDLDFALARYTGDAQSFDLCLQDDSSGAILKINTTTGEYQFTSCSGLTISGTGRLIKKGSVLTLQHYGTDRRVLATFDGGVNRGSATVRVFSLRRNFTVMDRNTTNNTCICP
jgi:uncharacterized delta-60 repeat protein